VRNRKERLVNAPLRTAALPTPFVSPLASPLTSTVVAGTALTVSEPFTASAGLSVC
jgi:hypothetical protein